MDATTAPRGLARYDRWMNERLYARCATLSDADDVVLRFADGLTPERLATTLTFRAVVDQREHTMPTWLAVTQLFNHQTHHRGQLTTLLSQLGLDPGVTDLPWTPGVRDL